MKRPAFLMFVLGIVIAVAVSSGVSWLMINHQLEDRSLTAVPPRSLNMEQRDVITLETRDLVTTFSAEGTVLIDSDTDQATLRAPVTDDEVAYQLMDSPDSIRAEIFGGPTGFDCAWEGLVDSEQGLMIECAIPDDIRVVSGLRGRMVLRLGDVREVEALPLSAVFGANQTGEVVVRRSDDTLERRAVELGASDGSVIEITGGLDPNEEVLLYPTASDLQIAEEES